MGAAVPALPQEIYGVFSDQVNQASVQRIFQNFAIATQAGVLRAHVLFQSAGGIVGDGVCLYNFFRQMPIELTLYNAGSVQSIAVIAFLGARHRKTSTTGVFGVHRTSFSPQNAQAAQLEGFAEMARLDDARTEMILRHHLKLNDPEWTALNHRDIFFAGEDAIKRGFADEIGDFAPPAGTKVFNI